MKKDESAYLNEPLPPPQRQRGSLLTGWLIFLLVANVLGGIRSAESRNMLGLIWAVFGLLCVFGIWNWFKWAYYAIFLGFMFNMAVSLDTGSVQMFMFQIVYIAVTYALIHSRLDEFR